MPQWSKKRTRERVQKAVDELKDLKVTEAQNVPDLDKIGLQEARIVRGAHIYVEFVNAPELLATDHDETERSHRKFLRFLHLYQRAVHFCLRHEGASKVDFQNQRLHTVVAGSDDPAEICRRAVRLGLLISAIVELANDGHDDLPDATVCVGIEYGPALAVRNGAKGDREPLFLGPAANRAAKLLCDSGGVFLGASAATLLKEDARRLDTDPNRPDVSEVAQVLAVNWRKELEEYPLSKFSFSEPQLPLSGLDLDGLSPANSKRSLMVSVFADIDGFSAFVDRCLSEGRAEDAARVLHVARKELRDTLCDLGGRKVRYHGDCLQGVLAAGDGVNVDTEESAVLATAAATALLDAFDVIKEELPAATELELAVGIEAGPVTLTRLGVRGSMDRCAAGEAVLASERLQRTCDGREVAVGDRLRLWLPTETTNMVDADRKLLSKSYNDTVHALTSHDAAAARRVGLTKPRAPAVVLPRSHTRD